MQADVSVIILTFNEEKNIGAALDSVVHWAREIFVVDSFSTDRTVDLVLARTEGHIHVVQNTFVDYSQQWNWALSNLPLAGNWTLKLDADERVTPEFVRDVDHLLQRNTTSNLEGIYFRRKMYFMGAPVIRGGFSTTYVMHMWKTGCAHFEDRQVNEHAMVKGQTAKIGAFIDHHDFKSLSDWIEKHNRYSSMEARCLINGQLTGDIEARLFGNPDQRRMALRKLYRQLPSRHVLYFLYRYVWLRAYLDGKAGFRYCLLHAFYRYWIDLKHEEYQRTGITPEVRWPVRGKPHPGLKTHGFREGDEAST